MNLRLQVCKGPRGVYQLSCIDMIFTVHRHPVEPATTDCLWDSEPLPPQDGAVFTFGSGQHGQLGHNSFRDELRPRLVAELLGAKVTDVACGMYSRPTSFFYYSNTVITSFKRKKSNGSHCLCVSGDLLLPIPYLLRHHTLVLTDSKKVYSFGRGEQGQLGHGGETHPSVPLPVQLPQGDHMSGINEMRSHN